MGIAFVRLTVTEHKKVVCTISSVDHTNKHHTIDLSFATATTFYVGIDNLIVRKGIYRSSIHNSKIVLPFPQLFR